jgi:outer membrane usher protein
MVRGTFNTALVALLLAPPALAQVATPQLVPLEVVLNGASVGNWLLLQAPGGFYAAREALDAWRLQPRTEGERLEFQRERWYPLSAIDGYSANLNPARQSIDLGFAASAFVTTQVTAAAQDAPITSNAEPAIFVNYDLHWSHARIGGLSASRDLGMLTELGVTGPMGLLTSSFLGRHAQNIGGTDAPWRRLETTFTRDFPERKFSVRLGDSTTRGGLLGRPIYFGGIQVARNFELAPGFVTQPLPVITGSSAAPSTVDLYINDALRQTLNVPAGPFAIDNPMPIGGDGQARLVVRDVLGRETVITQSFFTHSELLEQGLSDWSFELGAARNQLGIANADYGERFASGLWRQGLSKRLTLETRGEWGAQTRGMGIGITQALPWQALGQASLAWSQNDSLGRGAQWSLGGEYSNGAQAFSLQAQGASAAYRTVGAGAFEPAKWQLSGSFSHTHERLGTFGIGLARLDSRQRGRLRSYSLNHTQRLGLRGTLSFLFTQVQGSTTSGRLVAVSLQWPLEGQINTAAYVSQRSGQTDAYATASQGLRGDTGMGWRVLGGTRNGQALAEAGIHLQGARSLFTVDASASEAQQALRLGTQGGFVLVGGRLFASRPVLDSFAIVDVADLPDVGVSFQGRELVRTDEQGQALVTGLQPYSANSVRLNPSDIPISAEIDSVERMVVPRLRSAVKLSFPVRSGRAALVTVRLADGQPAPAGAEIERVGSGEGDRDDKRFPVGRAGQAFITGLQRQQALRLHWSGASCTLPLTLPDGSPDDIARPPPLICEGITP